MNPNSPQTPIQNANTTLNGGVNITVTKKDKSTEQVFIRQLEIWEFPALLDALGKEIEMIMLFCAKEKAWAKTLSVESWEQLVTTGEEINSDFFSRWVRRQVARQERLMPGVTDRVVKAASVSTITSPS